VIVVIWQHDKEFAEVEGEMCKVKRSRVGNSSDDAKVGYPII